MNFHSFPNASVWQSASAPSQAKCFATTMPVQVWGARGPSVASDNAAFWAPKKPAAGPSHIVNNDTRSWGGRGTGTFAGDGAQGLTGNSWGAHGPSVVTGGQHFAPAPAPAQVPHWKGSTAWSALQQPATQWAPAPAPKPAPAPAPAAPATGDNSWANQSASQGSQSQGNDSGSWSWANVNANPANGGAATQTGNGGNDWVNAGNGSQNGTGSASGSGTGSGTGDSVSGNGGTAGTGTGSGSEWVDAGNSGGAAENATGGTGENGQAGDTATGDTATDGADNATDTGTGETGSGTGDTETGTGEAGSGSEVDNTAPVELDATQQLDNVQFLQGLVGNESPSEADMNRVVQIYNSFRLSPEEMTNLQTLAQQTTARMFSTEGQDFAANAQNWSNLSGEERESVITAFFQGMLQDMGLETTIGFYDTPPTEQGLVSHGQYDPETDVLSVNVNLQAHDTLPKVMTTVFHELVHAYYFKQTEHITTSEIPGLVESGELTYAQALTHLNVFPPLYLAEEEFGLINYSLNPHEQLAFTGQYLFDQAIIDAGYEHERVIANDNPLFTHMQQHGFA